MKKDKVMSIEDAQKEFLNGLELTAVLEKYIENIEEIVDVMKIIGHDIIASKRFSVYSGDELVVYKKDNLFHIYVGSFGTCPYCDEVINCIEFKNYKGLIELATTNTTYSGETLEIAIEKLKENSWANVWDFSIDEFVEWLESINSKQDKKL